MKNNSGLGNVTAPSATRLIVLLAMSVLFSMSVVGCKKITFDLANSGEPEDAPEYSVDFNPNLSPAEGGVRKPN